MNKTILKMTVPSNFDGAQPDGIIGISQLGFNRSYWEAHDQLSSIVILDGESLTIRRDGLNIYIERS